MTRTLNEGLATAPTFTPHRVNVTAADTSPYGGTRASFDIATAPSVNCDTVIEDTDVGVSAKTIAFIHSAGAPNAGVLSEVAGAFTFTFKGGTTTVADFEAALGDGLQVKTPGTVGVLAAVDDEFAAQALAGGIAGIPSSHGMMASEHDAVVAQVKIDGSSVDLKVLVWSDLDNAFVDQSPVVEFTNLTASKAIRFNAGGQRFFIWVGDTLTRVDISVAAVPSYDQQA